MAEAQASTSSRVTCHSGDVSSSRPDGTGWFAAGHNNGTVAQNLTVYVLCVL